MAHNIAFAKNSMLPYGMERMVKGARILALTGLRFFGRLCFGGGGFGKNLEERDKFW